MHVDVPSDPLWGAAPAMRVTSAGFPAQFPRLYALGEHVLGKPLRSLGLQPSELHPALLGSALGLVLLVLLRVLLALKKALQPRGGRPDLTGVGKGFKHTPGPVGARVAADASFAR